MILRIAEKLIDITVIIPAYNVAQYIGDAIESAIKQDPPFTQIIVIDDGSSDGTSDVIAKYSDPRIVYYYQDNQGLGPARNKGIELANTEWLYFMDGDDVLEDGMTRFIYDAIYQTDPPPDAVFFSAINFEHETGETLPTSSYYAWKSPGVYPRGIDAMLKSLQSECLPVCVFIYVFRKSLIEQPKKMRFLNIIHEDEVFTPALLFRCGRTIVSKKILYRRRVRSNSIMTTAAGAQNVIGYLTAANEWMKNTASYVGDDAVLLNRHIHYWYGRAMLYSARAKLSLAQIRALVAMHCPHFRRWVPFDHLLSRASRKIAFWVILFRARFSS